ncbi:MAG: exonuclease domain-containing protein [Patescibacteria group bacterium]
MFIKPILIIDFESFGLGVDAEPTQIGAILIDPATLEEKDSFTSYIWTDMQGKTGKKSGINQETLEGAPSKAEVGRLFFEKFGTEVLLGSWAADKDKAMHRKLMIAAGIDHNQYDYHIMDLWPVAYIHLVKEGYRGKIDSESIFQEFGMSPRGNHDALEDCRIAAEVLRKLMKNSLSY